MIHYHNPLSFYVFVPLLSLYENIDIEMNLSRIIVIEELCSWEIYWIDDRRLWGF
jgi:hypothetical protein